MWMWKYWYDKSHQLNPMFSAVLVVYYTDEQSQEYLSLDLNILWGKLDQPMANAKKFQNSTFPTAFTNV